MRCDSVRQILAASTYAWIAPWTRWRIGLHVARCGACRAAMQAQRALEEGVARMREVAPPPALRARIASAVAQAPEVELAPLSRPDRRRRWRLVEGRTMRRMVTALVALGALALLAGSAWNRSAYAMLARMETAASRVRSVHLVRWDVQPDGTRVKGYEMWHQDGRWRREHADPRPEVGITIGDRHWWYDREDNTVTLRREHVPSDYPSGFSVKAMAADFARWNRFARVRWVGRAALNGHAVEQFDIQGTIVSADPETGLPIRFDSRDARSRHVADIEYNLALPDDLFDPALLSPTARFVDADREKRLWGERLSKPIATRKVGNITVALRDVQANNEGDVFLLYTRGERAAGPRDYDHFWTVKVTDDLGTAYCKEHGIDVFTNKPYVFDGERLQASWIVPVAPQRPWTGRRLTITLTRFASSNGARVRRPVGAATFTVPVSDPTIDLVPGWMPYLTRAQPRREEDVHLQRARVRAEHYREREDYAAALPYYQEALAMPAGSTSSELWRDLGYVLAKLDRREDARAAYETALRQPGVGEGDRSIIQQDLTDLR